MDCTARIFASGDADRMLECFAPEDTSFERSSFTINNVAGGVEFNVKADDAVALRATLNTISQLLIVFDGAGRKEG